MFCQELLKCSETCKLLDSVCSEAHTWIHYDAKNCPSWVTIGKDKPDVIVQDPTTCVLSL